MQTVKAVVDLGADDPDLFVALERLEEGVGPDRISDIIPARPEGCARLGGPA